MEKNNKFFVYVLLCEDGSFYTGYTNNVKKRFVTHQSGKGAKYTRAHKPVKIIFQKEFESKSAALSYEYHFKKLSKQQKINTINDESITNFN